MNSVQKISYDEAHPWILHKHYAKRIPNIKYAYGLFEDRVLTGVVTFGLPPSNTLCSGVCGDEFKHQVLELNRLCIESKTKNSASLLVARSMKLLPKETIVVSYADTSMGHIGYVYQAANFIYTGISPKQKYYRLKNLSSNTRIGLYRRRERMAKTEIIKEYGEDMVEEYFSTNKHRYVYFIGSAGWKNKMRKKLNYKEQPHPKGEPSRYDASYQPNVQTVMF